MSREPNLIHLPGQTPKKVAMKRKVEQAQTDVSKVAMTQITVISAMKKIEATQMLMAECYSWNPVRRFRARYLLKKWARAKRDAIRRAESRQGDENSA